jgi:hypothetical protein
MKDTTKACANRCAVTALVHVENVVGEVTAIPFNNSTNGDGRSRCAEGCSNCVGHVVDVGDNIMKRPIFSAKAHHVSVSPNPPEGSNEQSGAV